MTSDENITINVLLVQLSPIVRFDSFARVFQLTVSESTKKYLCYTLSPRKKNTLHLFLLAILQLFCNEFSKLSFIRHFFVFSFVLSFQIRNIARSFLHFRAGSSASFFCFQNFIFQLSYIFFKFVYGFQISHLC